MIAHPMRYARSSFSITVTKQCTNCAEQVRSKYALCLFQPILKQLRGAASQAWKSLLLMME